MTLRKPEPVRAGELLQLACTAKDSNPKTTLVWFRQDNPIPDGAGKYKYEVQIIMTGNLKKEQFNLEKLLHIDNIVYIYFFTALFFHFLKSVKMQKNLL